MVEMFYHGSLQEGIALAVSQSKAVICFARDDEQLSTVWENEYFADDDEFAQLLEAKSIMLRITKDSQEAGFLTSFCPITNFPAVVVIKDGMLREYIIPDISKGNFRDRLRTVLKDDGPANQVNSSQPPQTGAGNDTATASTTPIPQPSMSTPPTAPQPQPEARTATNATEAHRNERVRAGTQAVGDTHEPKPTQRQANPSRLSSQKPQQRKEEGNRVNQTKQLDNKKNTEKRKETPAASSNNKTVDTEPRSKPAPTPPKQYRLQVRLFDGSSVRSSFTPSQTIRRDVRPWLDEKMEEQRPYNLKHILTPLPNRTLTIADEEQTLEELSLGATANLIMVPIQTYTQAYAAAGPSLPVRAVNTAYDLASSAVGTATGLVGSFFGYGQANPSQGPPAAESSSSGGDAQRQAPTRPAVSRGPNIRTLGDQQREQGNSQLYNGNQLNFEPRRNPDQQ